MAANYVLLERIELNASAASVTFSNIPQSGYTDLKLVISARTDRAASIDDCRVRPNNSTASQTMRRLQGSGSSASSYSDTQVQFITPAASATASTFSNTEVYIPNYTSSNSKSFSTDGVTENNATAAYQHLDASLFASSTAISSIVIDTYVGSNFVQYSTFSLYGLAAVGTTPAIAPKAVGGSIYTDNTYWYHVFRTTDSFVPQVTLSCDVMVVAGGGSGGNYGGGGGGAGGLLSLTSQSVSSSTTVVIGAGGSGVTGTLKGIQGTSSSFGASTATGGGYGGGGNNTTDGAGGNGGSGGGAAGVTNTLSGGTATSGQGNAGGSATGTSGGAGGGGASTAGSNGGSSENGGNGGTGSSTYSSWGSVTNSGQNVSSTYYFAGGGGGAAGNSKTAGTGGSGGGGTGGVGVGANGNSATVNTGGGGGGCWVSATSGNGGSGIVIVRYPV